MSTPQITYGVALYSYGGDFLVTMTLEDCLADVADMGASDVEILADTHIPGYPTRIRRGSTTGTRGLRASG